MVSGIMRCAAWAVPGRSCVIDWRVTELVIGCGSTGNHAAVSDDERSHAATRTVGAVHLGLELGFGVAHTSTRIAGTAVAACVVAVGCKIPEPICGAAEDQQDVILQSDTERSNSRLQDGRSAGSIAHALGLSWSWSSTAGTCEAGARRDRDVDDRPESLPRDG